MHILFGNYSEKIVYVCCRSLRGSVDWNHYTAEQFSGEIVAPSAGAWIEIFSIQSHIPVILVAPSAGAWIEIVKQLNELLDKEVAPSAGAWIEIWSLT